MSRYLRPADLARATGLSTQSVRTYETLGFLPPVARSSTGHRQYDQRHLRAIEAARVMQVGYGWMPALQIMRRLHQGDIILALELVDARHAELHAGRREIEEILAALRLALEQDDGRGHGSGVKREDPVRVAAAAHSIGVPTSSLRFWEQAGLIHPKRDTQNRYRLYDRTQVRNLRVISTLRQANYSLERIATVLTELGQGRPESTLAAIRHHRAELIERSRCCAAATAAFWDYLNCLEEGR